jgi:branched-chain amino acid transport system substrate-binding protein
MRKAIAIAAAVAFAIAAAPAAAQIKIGFIATFSGPGGALGQDLYDAFMLGIDHAGGKLGGQAVEVIKEDDLLKPEVGVQIAQKLIERDRVQIITGVIFSNVMMAIHKPITDARVFFIGSNAGPTPLTGKGCSPYFFSTSWNNDSLHEPMGKLATDLGYKRIYVLAPNYQAGKDAINGVKRYFKGQILEEVYTQVNQPDYAAEIAQAAAARPDALYVFFPGGMGINFLRQYQQAGLLGKIPLLSTATIDGTTLPAIKEAAIGTITASPYSPDLDNPQNKKFVANFRKKYGRIPSWFAAQSYDAAQLLDSALRKVKGDLSNKEAFRAALKAADFKSVTGPFRFNTNQFPIRNYYRVDVVRDASGQPAFATKGIVFQNHADAYAKECPLK